MQIFLVRFIFAVGGHHGSDCDLHLRPDRVRLLQTSVQHWGRNVLRHTRGMFRDTAQIRWCCTTVRCRYSGSAICSKDVQKPENNFKLQSVLPPCRKVYNADNTRIAFGNFVPFRKWAFSQWWTRSEISPIWPSIRSHSSFSSRPLPWMWFLASLWTHSLSWGT